MVARNLSRHGSVHGVLTHLWSSYHRLGRYSGHVHHNDGGGDGVSHVNGGDSDKVYGGGAYDEDPS